MIQRAKVAHFTDHGHEVRGIVHVGAHEGQEIPYYLRMGHVPILAFEPHPDVYSALCARFAHEVDVTFIPLALGDEDGKGEMFIPRHLHDFTDDSQSGSLLMPDHDSSYPWGDRGVEGRFVPVEVRRFDSLLIAQHPFNTLVVDVQGYEFQTLTGFGDRLEGFDFLNIECSREPIYRGGATAQEVIDFLADRGFRQDTPIQDHDDIFFIREGL